MSLIAAEHFDLDGGIAEACVDILRERGIATLDAIPHSVIRHSLLEHVRTQLGKAGAAATLADDRRGFVTVAFPTQASVDLQTRIVLHAAMFSLVSSALFEGSRDGHDVPFDLYKSTTENTGLMQKAGVRFYSPDQKLGYHNDVYFNLDHYYVPHYVSLVNLFIGYHEPGNFYYINNHIWSRFEDVFARGVGLRFRFRPTPSLLESDLEKYRGDVAAPPEPKWTEIHAFWEDDGDRKYAFCNGELCEIDDDQRGVIDDMKSSLLSNETKFFTQQEVGKIMVFRNDVGYHSRDIFKEQHVFEGVTRLFLRAVSRQSFNIPTPN